MTLRDPIDPRQQTAIGWGQRSNWLQPWRAYLDTRPGPDLANGTGVIFDAPPGEVAQAARLLAESGFRRPRYIVDWSSVYRTSGGTLAFREPGKFAPVIEAFRQNGLRPMILLNAQPEGSGFTRPLPLNLARAAAAGDRTVALTPAAARAATAERAAGGHVGLAAYKLTPGLFVTSVHPDGTAGLSRPLESALPAGRVNFLGAEVGPFERPERAGAPNPAFEETLDAWLEYVGFVTTEVERVLGTDAYDVEIWNELSFDSEFLDADVYSEPDVDTGTGDTNREILERTAAFLKDPANGVAGVRVGDGFAANDPLPSGATAPAGVDAVNKHPYAPLWDIYPGVAQRFPHSKLGTDYPALDALGEVDDQLGFVPSFRSHFPEHFLTGMQTDHLIRDLSPITTYVDGVPHGRTTRSADGTQPRIWISEHTLLPVTPTPEANRHVQTKIALRSLLSYLGAGAELVALYSVNDQQFGLVEPNFFAKAKASRGYPGAEAGGRTMDAFRRIARTVGTGPGPSEVSPLRLLSISDCHSNAIFAGNGTDAHPALYDRDALTFFPFQTSERRYVVPYWVMTRDVAKVYRPGLAASDLRRYDFPPETFTLEVGGVKGDAPLVSALDPVTGDGLPATVVGRRGDVLEIEVEATDSPRLLVIEG